ncbi:hypothetical protein V1512DRAFT_225994 [Lipomyces arxii]|uniref:uncharacterized protein n=1 Tax=Lipomyces arxii TaxID=56418 RepID=UPI0034CE2653
MRAALTRVDWTMTTKTTCTRAAYVRYYSTTQVRLPDRAVRTLGSVTTMRATVRRLVYRLDVLTMLLDLMRSVRQPRSKAFSVDVKEQREKFFAAREQSRKQVARVSARPRPMKENPTVVVHSVEQQTAAMTWRELRKYHMLRELGVAIQSLDLVQTRTTSAVIAAVVMDSPDPGLKTNTGLLSLKTDMRPDTAPRLPMYRKKNTSRLNKQIAKLLGQHKESETVGRLTKFLLSSSILPNLESFELVLYYFANSSYMPVASFFAIDAIIEAGYSIRPYTIRIVFRLAVRLQNAQLAEYMVSLLVRESRNLRDDDKKALAYWLLDDKLINALMSTAIKLRRPDLYSVFRNEFIRRRMYPTMEILTAEIRFACLTKNTHLAEDAWAVLKHLDLDLNMVRASPGACLWMARYADEVGNKIIMKEVVDLATKRQFMHRMHKLELKYRQ